MFQISQFIKLIIVVFQLVLYLFLILIAVYKLIKSFQNNSKFLSLFYIFLFLDCIVYEVIMIYQLVILITTQNDINLILIVIINIYSIIIESYLLFLLSFYWKETQTLLRGSGVQFQESATIVKNQLKIKAICILLWFLMYTAYMMYTFIQQNYFNQLNSDLFYYAGQGISMVILLWSNIQQLFNARNLSQTLNKFQSLISFSMNKTIFRCIYWVATTFNFLRLIYLIAITVLNKVVIQSIDSEWLEGMIYTVTGIIPLAIYLYSFQINDQQKQSNSMKSFSDQSARDILQIKNNMSGLYQPPIINNSYVNNNTKNKNSMKKKTGLSGQRQSFAQTQLSSSYDSKNGI